MGSDVSKSYGAGTIEEQEAHYDDWAERYERELCAAGYRLPILGAAAFARFVEPGSGPILDAGCGGGLQSEPLAALGYEPITGVDLSEGMLAVARSKGVYAELRRMILGDALDFPSDHFAGVLCIGAITPGHAPAESFDELLRVARPGAPIVFSLRDDPAQDPSYPAAVERMTAAGRWAPLHATPSIASIPYTEPHIRHRIHVMRVSG